LHRIAHQIGGLAVSAGRRTGAAWVAAVMALALAMPLTGALAQQTEQSSPQFGAAPPAAPALETKEFQDWVVRCGPQVPGAPDTCEMVQQRQDEQGQTVLAVAVGKISESNEAGMLIILPLGIWLPPGVIVKVDGGEELPGRIERCERRGCQVELLLDPKALAVLKNGREANVLFHIYDEQGVPKVVGVPFSLLGFTAALNEVLAS
jgi:invasion protein IalB